MADVEMVINGMEKIYESYVDSEIVERHDYGDTRTADIFKQNASIIHDALELLKAQEPRVMTLDEVRNAYHSPMWFESHGTFRGQKGFWCLHLGVSPSFHIRLMPAIGEQSTELSLTAYGIVWRCWTSRPTDEQMEVVKWE